jgi:PAS domain-containing protein
MGRMWRDAIDGRLRAAGVNFDITARKATELAARESRVRYHLLRESMMDAHGGVDNNGRFREANQHLLDMLGYTSGE